MMEMMRCLLFFHTYWGNYVEAKHNQGEQNVLPDVISQGNLPLLFRILPEASPYPTLIPQSLHKLLVAQQPDWMSENWVTLFKSCLQQV